MIVKSQDASNCVANASGVATVLNVINRAPGYPVVPGVTDNPFALLAICPYTDSTTYVFHPNDLAGLGIVTSDGVPVDLSGKKLPNAPEWTFSLGAQYAFELGDWTLTPRADY